MFIAPLTCRLQYDMAFGCFERALFLATDSVMADIWYNISHVALALGDLGLSFQVRAGPVGTLSSAPVVTDQLTLSLAV